jgi:hypothetical protein
MWEPRPLTTLLASTACYRDSVVSFYFSCNISYLSAVILTLRRKLNIPKSHGQQMTESRCGEAPSRGMNCEECGRKRPLSDNGDLTYCFRMETGKPLTVLQRRRYFSPDLPNSRQGPKCLTESIGRRMSYAVSVFPTSCNIHQLATEFMIGRNC